MIFSFIRLGEKHPLSSNLLLRDGSNEDAIFKMGLLDTLAKYYP